MTVCDWIDPSYFCHKVSSNNYFLLLSTIFEFCMYENPIGKVLMKFEKKIFWDKNGVEIL